MRQRIYDQMEAKSLVGASAEWTVWKTGLERMPMIPAPYISLKGVSLYNFYIKHNLLESMALDPETLCLFGLQDLTQRLNPQGSSGQSHPLLHHQAED